MYFLGKENVSKFSPGHSSELWLTMSFQVVDTALQASFEDIDRLEKILHKSSGGRWLIPVLPIFRYFSLIWTNKNFGRHFASYIEYIRWGIIYQILKICHSVFQDQNQKSKSWCCEVTKENKIRNLGMLSLKEHFALSLFLECLQNCCSFTECPFILRIQDDSRAVFVWIKTVV